MSYKRNLPDYAMLSALGYIRGVTSFRKFGRNNDIDTSTVPEEIWNGGGLRYYPSTAAALNVVSTNANDTAAGTGARTVRVTGLDANWNEISEIVTLNGLTPVQTVNSYLRADIKAKKIHVWLENHEKGNIK